MNVYRRNYSAENSETNWYAHCNCGVECNRLEYSLETSYSRIIQHHSQQNATYVRSVFQQLVLLICSTTFRCFRENYVSINVYMKRISYEERNQVKKLERANLLGQSDEHNS